MSPRAKWGTAEAARPEPSGAYESSSGRAVAPAESPPYSPANFVGPALGAEVKNELRTYLASMRQLSEFAASRWFSGQSQPLIGRLTYTVMVAAPTQDRDVSAVTADALSRTLQCVVAVHNTAIALTRAIDFPPDWWQSGDLDQFILNAIEVEASPLEVTGVHLGSVKFEFSAKIRLDVVTALLLVAGLLQGAAAVKALESSAPPKGEILQLCELPRQPLNEPGYFVAVPADGNALNRSAARWTTGVPARSTIEVRGVTQGRTFEVCPAEEPILDIREHE